MTRKQISRFAVGYPYPTVWVQNVLKYCDYDTKKAHVILCDNEKTLCIIRTVQNLAEET